MLKSRANPLVVTGQQQSSTNSELSTESLMSGGKTTSTDATSPLTINISDDNDSDNINSDREENDYRRNIIRRGNLRQLEATLYGERNNNNNNKSDDNSSARLDSFSDTNDNMVYSSPESSSTENRNDDHYACPICGFVSNTQHDYTEHILGHSSRNGARKYNCQICSKVLSSSSSLKRHVLVHTGERPFTCKRCFVTFQTGGNLQRHMLTHRKQGEDNYDSDGSNDSIVGSAFNIYGKRRFIEDDETSPTRRLTTTTTTTTTINNNNIVEEPEQRLWCLVCGRSGFSTMLHLANHIYLEHQRNGGSFDAPKDFSIRKQPSEISDEDAKRDDFFAPLDLQNKLTPQMADSESNKSFNQSDQSVPQFVPKELPPHGRRIEEESADSFNKEYRKMKLRSEFPCKLCSAVLPNLRALKGHNRTHLTAGPEPYRCNMCSFSVCHKTALITHMRTHNGSRPYECTICNYAFTLKANCERHLRNRHGKTTKAEVMRFMIHYGAERHSRVDDSVVKKMKMVDPSCDDEVVAPIDLSSPLSRLKDIAGAVRLQLNNSDQPSQATIDEVNPDMGVGDLAQRQKMEENKQFPNIDPAHYFQMAQFYQNLILPTPGFPIHPLFLQHAIMAHNNEGLPEDSLAMTDETGSQISPPPSATNLSSQLRTSSQEHDVKSSQVENQQPLPSSTQQPNRISGPVKMVMKNGVLTRKQLRYRTERPFACECCAAQFTLRSNRDRHFKAQHPEQQQQQRYDGVNNSWRDSDSNKSERITTPPSAAHPQLNATFQQVKCRSEQSSDCFVSMDSGMDVDDGNTLPPQPKDVEDSDVVIVEDSEPEDFSTVRRVASLILEGSTRFKMSQNTTGVSRESDEEGNAVSRETIGKLHGPSSEEGDFVSVSKLVDNATSNSISCGNYFCPDIVNEHKDEEGLVASSSASESNNSRTEDPHPQMNQKKSSYSQSHPVSCPHCQRMFPWTSSLRRHILTHTGRRPFKCSHCSILFSTKSNCDRHRLRKHGNNVGSVTSLYIPEDVPERQILAPVQRNISVLQPVEQTTPVSINNSSDTPFKCHLCTGSFSERSACLEHIRNFHTQEFSLLTGKGAMDLDAEQLLTVSADDEEKNENRGECPDNRKVTCAFCMRRLLSSEDLRRHMRKHSGERPFQCNICMRKFSLKHSLIRHQKRHTNTNSISGNSASDLSDDEKSTSLVAAIPSPKELQNELGRGFGADSSELIANMLGISDPRILNRVLLSSPDEAAKLLGVEK